MPQHWLKPLGTTQPQPDPVSDDWTSKRGLEDFELTTGPATIKKPPKMGRGDRVLLHAVIHSRIFAEGEVLGNPSWQPTRTGGERWPWVYPCRIDVWVPLVKDGPITADVAPKKALGRIQAGGEYALLTKADYDMILAALLAAPTVHTL